MKVGLATVGITLGFYTVFFPVSIAVVICLVIVGTLRRPFLSHRNTIRMVRLYIKYYGLVAIRLGFPWFRVQFENQGPDDPLPCIYICNHRSSSDPFLMAVLPDEFIQVVNVWPFRLPVYGFFARLSGYLSVREMPVDDFINQGKALLGQGVSIAGFPEGTRSGDRQMGPFHGTMFRLALAAQVPIVPVCLSGNERIPAKGTMWIQRGVIRVRKLPAIRYETYRHMGPFKLKNYIHDCIAQELLKMEGAA